MFRRIGALVRKEFIQLSRDKRTLAMMILIPVLWLIAFGYAVNFDVNDLHVFVVNEAGNADAEKVIKRIDENEKLRITEHGTRKEAEKALRLGTTDVVLIFPKHYASVPKANSEQMKIWVDGSRLFTAQSAVREVNEELIQLQKENMKSIQQSAEKGLASRNTQLPPLIPPQIFKQIQQTMLTKLKDLFPDPDRISPEVEVFFNPDLKSVNYMIPGLMGLVLIFITTLMTALGIVREKERGTLEQLIVSPLSSFELILGKILPYMLIASIDFALVMIVGTYWFHVPFTGDLFSYLLASLLFLFASLGVGLLVSTLSQNQQQAMQLAVLTLVPQIILSGFIFPLDAMPWGIRWLSYLMPLTYFLPISRDVFLKGLSAWDHPTAFAMLAVFAVLFVLVATVRFRRSLA